MDFVTFFFAMTPPLLAIALAVFAGASSAYVEREARLTAQEFGKARLTASVQAGIQDAILRVSRGALLIANAMATFSSCMISLYVPFYFLPGNYFVAAGATAVVVVYAGWVLTNVMRYGLKDVYIQKVRTRKTEETGHTRSYTYGTLIDYGMIALNVILALLVFAVYLYTAPPENPVTSSQHAPVSATQRLR